MNTTGVSIIVVLCAFLVSGGAMAAERKAAITGIQSPVGMIYDTRGALYVAEWGAGRVSRFDPDGGRVTVTEAIRGPSGLALGREGTLYVASYSDGGVYALENGKEPEKIASGFSSPAGLLWSRDNTLLVANRNAGEVVKLHPDGRKEVISRNHKTPVGLAQTADGSIFVSCLNGGIDLIRPDGVVSTINSSLNSPAPGIVIDGPDGVLAADYGGTTVTRVDARGRASTVANGLRTPVGLARTPDGRLMVGTWGDNAAFILETK